MIRIFEDNSILGVSSVMMKNPFTKEKNKSEVNKTTVENEGEDADLSKLDINTELENGIVESAETTDSILEACMEDTGLSMEDDLDSGVEQEEDLEENVDPTIYNEYVASLNEQIEFLKGQINEKNRQLTTKDELILNFQYLLKEDRSRILLLENKLDDNKVSFWKRLFNPKESR